MVSEAMKMGMAALASGVVVGFAVVATLAETPPSHAETPADARAADASSTPSRSRRTTTTSPQTVVTRVAAAEASEAVVEERYLVRPGDTLWDIAARYYDDVPAAMLRIKRRNGLGRDKVLAGEILILPTAGRRNTDVSDLAREDRPATTAPRNDAVAP